MQVAQYNLFQQYHESSPSKHTPPIPTVSVHPAASWRLLRNICYQQRYVTESYTASEEGIRATAAALLEAAKQLERDPHAQSIWAHDTSIQGSSVRKYIIKRNHAGFARKVIKLTLGLDNWQSTPSLTSLLQRKNASAQHQGQSDANNSCSYDSPAYVPVATYTGNTDAGLMRILDPARSSRLTAVSVLLMHHSWKLAQRLLHSMPFISNKTSIPHSDHNSRQNHMLQTPAEGNLTRIPQEDKAAPFDSSKQTVSIQQPTDILQDAQQLLQAAERVLLESCGEDWLLQPFIPDMGTGEYRSTCVPLQSMCFTSLIAEMLRRGISECR